MTGPEAFQALAQYHALRLEIKGFRHSSGRSIAKHIREQHHIQGRTKQETLDNFQTYLRKEGILND